MKKGTLEVGAGFILTLLGTILAIAALITFIVLFTNKGEQVIINSYDTIKQSICNIFSIGPFSLCLFLALPKVKLRKMKKGLEWQTAAVFILFAIVALLIVAFFAINWPRILEFAERTLEEIS